MSQVYNSLFSHCYHLPFPIILATSATIASEYDIASILHSPYPKNHARPQHVASSGSFFRLPRPLLG